MANAFDTIWVTGLIYRLTLLNFPVYPVKTMSSYLLIQTFEKSLHRATYTWRRMWARLSQGGSVSPLLFSLRLCTSHYLSRRMTRPSWPWSACQCYLPTIWNPPSATYSDDWQKGVSPSTPRRARNVFVRAGRLILKPRPVNSSASQTIRLIQLVIWRWPFINDWAGRLVWSSLERMLPRISEWEINGPSP